MFDLERFRDSLESFRLEVKREPWPCAIASDAGHACLFDPKAIEPDRTAQGLRRCDTEDCDRFAGFTLQRGRHVPVLLKGCVPKAVGQQQIRRKLFSGHDVLEGRHDVNASEGARLHCEGGRRLREPLF
eukprot:912757-Rhodomonas_salina.2